MELIPADIEREAGRQGGRAHPGRVASSVQGYGGHRIYENHETEFAVLPMHYINVHSYSDIKCHTI